MCAHLKRWRSAAVRSAHWPSPMPASALPPAAAAAPPAGVSAAAGGTGAAGGSPPAAAVLLRRAGGLTQAVVGGVSLEVAHSDLAPSRQGDGAQAAQGDDDDGADAANELWTWFFEEGFSLASATGFARVWPGAIVLIRALGDPESVLRLALAQAGRQRSRAPLVVELGSGSGLVGLAAAAAAGADVLLTDTAAVVSGVLAGNLQRNAGAGPAAVSAPGSSAGLPGAVRVGAGSAAAAVLDWTVPVEQQLQGAATEPDVVIAAECIWLAELVEPFAAAASSLLLRPGRPPSAGADRPVLFLSSRERAKDGSATFARVGAALSALAARGCGDATLVARFEPGAGTTADEEDEDEEGPLLVYAIRPD
mmetsp:Transcript_22298/g.62582  ORF Transcript_22298/g.62582 Transcript_22298/m.62582 type:complete len:365 (+) Transcript_22298:3-1097(+)